jgi:hypothetical protein
MDGYSPNHGKIPRAFGKIDRPSSAEGAGIVQAMAANARITEDGELQAGATQNQKLQEILVGEF